MIQRRRPRVLHVGKYYPPQVGGMETHLQALCTRLQDQVEVEVIVSGDQRRTVHTRVDGVPVTRVGRAGVFASTPICPSMWSAIRGIPADIVHLHHPNPWAVAAYLASGHPGKLVVTYHSDVIHQRLLNHLYEPILRRVLDRASAIIASSPDYVESSALLTEYRDRCRVIPFGIDASHLQRVEPEAVNAIRRTYGNRLVLSVGRLVYYKGFEYLIRAMRDVEGCLLIVGEGPLHARLEEEAKANGVEDRVVFLGKVHDVAPYYYAADVFALASCMRSEAFGIVQIEAMACGTPVVNTSLRSGVPFVSPHGETGITVPPACPDALALGLNALLDDPRRRAALGMAARRRAAALFDLDGMVDNTLRLYSEVLEGSWIATRAPRRAAQAAPADRPVAVALS